MILLIEEEMPYITLDSLVQYFDDFYQPLLAKVEKIADIFKNVPSEVSYENERSFKERNQR